MGSITIRNLDDRLKQRLRERAAGHRQSMEAEAREILRRALEDGFSPSTASNLYEAIRAVVEPVGGIDIDITRREPVRESPSFES